MKELNNIDELLKESFNNFQPEAPVDVWSGIEQQLPHFSASASTEGLVAKIKATSALFKAGLVVVTAVSLTTVLYLVNTANNPQTKDEVLPEIPQVKQELADVTEKVDSQYLVQTKMPSMPTQPTQQKNSKKWVEPKENRKTESEISAILTNEKLTQKNNEVQDKLALHPEKTTGDELKSDKPSEQINLLPIEKVKTDSEANEIKPEPEIYNVLTPNGDGKNDALVIKAEYPFELFLLQIYNTSGNLVFESTQAENKWYGDDIKSGMPLGSGTYTFMLKYKYKQANEIRSKSGLIKLIR